MNGSDYESDSNLGMENPNKKRKIVQSMPEDVGKAGRPRKAPVNSSYTDYEPSFVMEFIEEVESEAVLWDTKNDQHHRNEVKNRIWDQIEQKCAKFMSRGRIHGNNSKKLWAELLLEYKKERRRMESLPSGSGRYTPKFPFMKCMEFLEFDRCNRDVKNAYVFAASSSNSTPTVQKPAATPKSRKSNDNFERLLSAVEAGNRVLNNACSQLSQPEREKSTENGDVHRLIDEVLKQASGVDRIRVKTTIMNYLFGLMNTMIEEKANEDALIFGGLD